MKLTFPILLLAGVACTSQIVAQDNPPDPSPARPTPIVGSGGPTFSSTLPAQKSRIGAARIYIEPQNRFESYISAAMVKKHVPAVVTADKDQAEFVLTSVVVSGELNTGSKVVHCVFLYCAGIAGSQTATVQLINAQTSEVAWGYNVHKPASGAYQSTAEAIAKHLKQFLEQHPQ